ncbi:MAG: tRNA (N(6)-L-threonylcarbamoyladenosine(37)-C(2))-methylthiotransferase MtaB [Pseudomonadota bacterium]
MRADDAGLLEDNTPHVVTLGCRLNTYESEVMRAHARSAGLQDCIIVNTCAVTREAVRQGAQTIRRLRRERPGAKLIVTGCAAQIEPERFAAIDGVDHVIGNGEKLQASTFEALAGQDTAKMLVNDIMAVKETAGHLVDGFGGRARAYVQVQNGCDHRCTFCIIPFGRGPSRSVPAGEVVAQVRHLVERGYAEVVLTGVDITDYGKGLPGTMTLGRLVRQVLKHVPELPRLRLSSIDQVEMDASLLDAIAEEARLMPHLHLSLQAGDDMILKRMKRRHDRATSIAFCERLRALRPDLTFGADIIAGFPTETEAMFTRSLDLVDACGLTHLHVFPFSPREGTPAARMPQVPHAEIKARAERLRSKGAHVLTQALDGHVGQQASLLMERGGIGRTPHFHAARLVTPTGAVPREGALVDAVITGHDGRRLQAEPVAPLSTTARPDATATQEAVDGAQR